MDLQGRNINILKDIGISFDWRVNKDSKKLEYRDLTGPEKLLVMQSTNFQSLLINFKKTKEMEKLWASFMESIGDLKLEFTTNDGITQLTNKINSWFDKFVCLYQAKDVTSYMHALPYLPVYKLNPCISRPPILEPKNKFFLFLGKNFLEKLILYFLEFSFRYYGYMKKITASLDMKFIIACTQAF